MKMHLTTYRTDIVPVYETSLGNKVVDGRELHAFLGIGKDFSNWVKRAIKKHNLIENKDYVVVMPDEIFINNSVAKNGKQSLLAKSGEQRRGGKNRKEYIFQLAPSKKIAMGTNNSKGDQVKDYFLECEKVAKAAQRLTLPDMYGHTQKAVQVQNAKAVNQHIWQTEPSAQAIGQYHRELSIELTGKAPNQLKKEAKAAGLPSKHRTSGREVMRYQHPAAACAASACDTLVKSGRTLDEVKVVVHKMQDVFEDLLQLGFIPKELTT